MSAHWAMNTHANITACTLLSNVLPWRPQVDAKPLRAELLPITSAALDRIKLLLLQMARDATLTALEDLRARIAQLQARPSQLDEFMAYQVRAMR